MNRLKRFAWMVALMLLFVGCTGTFEVGIERTPTPDARLLATVNALADENYRLATQVALQATPAPSLPDLGRLAYVKGGDIWIMNLIDETALPLRLTADGHNFEPRWSPSGQWLAFSKERTVPGNSTALTATQKQVWVIQADGSGEYPLNNGSAVEAFAWSPEDDRLAYTTPTGSLNLINADGTDQVLLISENAVPALGDQHVGRISWSLDGKWIAYEYSLRPTERFVAYQGIWVGSAQEGMPVEIYNSGFPNRSEAVLVGWSPLINEVLFLQNVSTTASSVDGGLLYAVQVYDDSETSGNRAPILIIGEPILSYADFVSPAPRNAYGAEQAAVAAVGGEGRLTWDDKYILIGGRSITGPESAAISPDWSPDGRRLAFAAMPNQDGSVSPESAGLMRRRIWIANAYGDPNLRRLTDSIGYRDENPQWSADGSCLLFARIDSRGRASLWIIPASGGAALQVVDELTPAPEPFDPYGHVDWDGYFDWWEGR